MDSGAILATMALIIVSAVAVGLGYALMTLAMTRPWHIIEINSDKSLRRIEKLTTPQASLKERIADLEQQLLAEKSARRMDILRAGGHPEVPAPESLGALDPNEFAADELQTVGERNV